MDFIQGWGIPGDDYYQRFRKTFNLSQKTQIVELPRKRSIECRCRFILLRTVIPGVSPSAIYNINESTLCLNPSRIKVGCPEGIAAHRVTSGPGKENITVLLVATAAGEKLAQHFVFREKNVWESWLPKRMRNMLGKHTRPQKTFF